MLLFFICKSPYMCCVTVFYGKLFEISQVKFSSKTNDSTVMNSSKEKMQQNLLDLHINTMIV